MNNKNTLDEKQTKSSFLLCANWKMNKNPDEARSYARQMVQTLSLEEQKKIVFFAPAFTLSALAEELADSLFGWGAQNCHFEDQGAFTGENSPLVLKQMGATYCLVGHSERRRFFFEGEYLIQKKVNALLKHLLQPVICVGESGQERKQGDSLIVVEKQLSGILKNVEFPTGFVYVAYEPVWAIGGNQSAHPEQIFDMRNYIHQLCESEGKSLMFLYGGSVNMGNIRAFSQISGVNGFLVGGASLDSRNFCNLLRSVFTEDEFS